MTFNKAFYFAAQIAGIVFLCVWLTQLAAPAFEVWILGLLLVLFAILLQIPDFRDVRSEVEIMFWSGLIFVTGLIGEGLVVGWVLPVCLFVYFLAVLVNHKDF